MTAMPEAVEIVLNQQLVEHEAAHAAAAMLQGLHVSEVRAPFWTLPEIEAGGAAALAGFASVGRRDDADGRRKRAIAVLAAHVGEPHWPPKWPLRSVPEPGDETDLSKLVKALELDQAGYAGLVTDVYALTSSREYERLEVAIVAGLERFGGRLDEETLLKLKTIAERATMEHTVKSATVETTTDLGEFTAIAGAYSIDRQGDEIIPGAFGKTIARWQNSGKRLPLHWNHESAASSVIGTIDPATMRETHAGLEVSGKLDISTNDTAREAWRSMKNNSMSLSFGYMVTHDHKRADGVNELHEIDLFEISIVPAPANADTRIVSMKSAGANGSDSLIDVLNAAERRAREVHRKSIEADELRVKAMLVARECAPVEIASFPC